MAYDYKQGKFKPRYPQKYIGDPNDIVYRSGWEKRVMQSLDDNSNVLKWASEEVIIPYISPIDNKPHRYFVDFYVEAKAPNGTVKKMLLEVKPKAQTEEPKKRSRKTKQYITEVMTWGVNQAKWKAAQEFCLDRGWEFKLITENELFNKKNK
jgi:hypothetical protein